MKKNHKKEQFVQKKKEHLVQKKECQSPFPIPLQISRCKNTSGCFVGPVGPIEPITCLSVPNTSPALFPPNKRRKNRPTQSPSFCHPLTEKTGKYTLKIPELLYDGIFSFQKNRNSCQWNPVFCGQNKSYGADKLSPFAEKSLFGKTIIEPPECAGLWPNYKPPITFIYDCHENVPCSDDYAIKCPTRV